MANRSDKEKAVPTFASEAEERAFWESHDSVGLVDWTQARRMRFPKLKPSMCIVSVELPKSLLEDIQVEASRWQVSSQTLIRTWLAEKVQKRG